MLCILMLSISTKSEKAMDENTGDFGTESISLPKKETAK